MSLEILVDRKACQGAKVCVRRAPHTFSLDDEGRSVVAEVLEDDEVTIRETANACPHFAILVRNRNSS